MIDGNLAALAIDGEAFPMTLRARTSGTYDEGGKWIPGSPVDLPIMAAIQPTTGANLEDLPEGLRTEARMFLWTRSVVKMDDIVIDGSSSYRVIFIWDRQRDGGFTKAALGLKAS